MTTKLQTPSKKRTALAVGLLILLVVWAIFASFKTLPETIALLTQGQSDCSKGLIYEYHNVSNCLDGGSIASLVFTSVIDLIGVILLFLFGTKLLHVIGLRWKNGYILVLLLLGFMISIAAGYNYSIDAIQNLAYVTEIQKNNKPIDQAEIKTSYDDSYYIISVTLDPSSKSISIKAPQCFLDSDQFKLQVLPNLNNLNGLPPNNPRVVEALSLTNTERIQRISNEACDTNR